MIMRNKGVHQHNKHSFHFTARKKEQKYFPMGTPLRVHDDVIVQIYNFLRTFARFLDLFLKITFILSHFFTRAFANFIHSLLHY